jgi:hypothetical protein
MENVNKCAACGRAFNPDARNHGRQSYCHRAECQRLRRTARQRLRRSKAAAKATPQKSHGETRGLQAASGIAEADIRQENPLIIGLISMITGLTDLESVERVYRHCWLRGLDILSADTSSAIRKPAVIRLMEQVSDQNRNTG